LLFRSYLRYIRNSVDHTTEMGNAGFRAESSLRSSSPTATRLSDDALESVLVPLDGLGLVDAVGSANLALAPPALGNALAGAGHADIEVHAVDTVLVSVCAC
jgi:hypothetical protein